MSLVNKKEEPESDATQKQALVVLTRRQQEKAEKAHEAPTSPTSLGAAENMPSTTMTEENGVFDFDDELFPPTGRDKERLMRSQKRENR